ncbi:ATP-grasp domain-containing protein [Geoalkalibacter halelectricus]|uniref:ATP-grasp domain-containing protein n=1 Tax=Geoalkalibacter halelectricus TaxID=2847045 RepID=UPI003D19ACB8
MRTLWIVSGGSEALPGIRRAKEMGLHVVVSDGNPKAPGALLADDFVLASTYDVNATVEAAKRYHREKRPVNGVISVAADVPLTVAGVAADLGLPGIPLETAQLASDKLAMKQRFAEKNIPIPWFCAVDSSARLRELVGQSGFPLVIKPVDSRGARGVLRLSEKVDLEWAFNQAKENSPTGRVMVEEYLSGPQISTESLLLPDKAYTPGFSDRNYEFLDRFSPYIIENGGEQPSTLSVSAQEAVKRCAEAAGRAMGIEAGIAKGDMVLTSEGPKVIEIAARLSGGWFSTDQIPLATGVDLMGAAIKVALGELPSGEELTPRYQRGVAIRYFFPEPGMITAIHNVEKARQIPGVYKLDFFLGPGDMVEPVTNHTKRCGYVITSGADRSGALNRAAEVIATVRIETRRV